MPDDATTQADWHRNGGRCPKCGRESDFEITPRPETAVQSATRLEVRVGVKCVTCGGTWETAMTFETGPAINT